ncbi:hypothetical protein TSOC_002703 [Tetrabaena socialis]|uniref:EF-hand domain-containing protein n=1 Tax=Tetrabaena socialis TaxID=47790 RepID=A0A2J8ADK7_9CHLO|nr:hypothetical protein TSOC_002703 [Tetrabaena socialis]|eukprot:PNH10592.1 hypothetical protein TSOC_002703 [Tetrabaena socialis]
MEAAPRVAHEPELQRLLYLMEAPEYCMRAFREHGVNGQDLLDLREEDFDDSRFKFPRHVQRKVLRVAQAWRTFQGITGSPTKGSISVDEYVSYYSDGRDAEAVARLRAAYRAVDANSNNSLTFEEFLVGFSLLDAAVAESLRPSSSSAPSDTLGSWFQL